MRLFLLPISHRQTLIYAQRINRQLTADTTYVERIVNRASAKWVEWEANEKGWQKKVTDWGNGAFARIPFQEWGLKSIPPLSARRNGPEGKEPIIVRFPPNVLKLASILDLLRKLATERQALHRRYMYWSIAGLPATLPFALVPVIPNLPFFYLAFRAWSHWRALNGSKHIQFLLDNNLIDLEPSEVLRKVYEIGTVPEQLPKAFNIDVRKDVSDSDREKMVVEMLAGIKAENTPPERENSVSDRLLLSKGSGKFVSQAIGVPGLDVEIERALMQVERSIAKKQEQSKVKQEQDSIMK